MDLKNIQELKALHGDIKKYSAEDDHLYTLCKTPNTTTFQSFLEQYEKDVYGAMIYLFEASVLTEESYENDFKLSVANSIVKDIKKASSFSVDPTPKEDEFKKSATLTRHAFHVDPIPFLLLNITNFWK